MTGDRPFMLLRARANERNRERFAMWFRGVHLQDVLRIPGIAAVSSGTTKGGTHLGFYSFHASESVQEALTSPQAAYTRGTWEQWAPHLEELAIEIWTSLSPLPLYHSNS